MMGRSDSSCIIIKKKRSEPLVQEYEFMNFFSSLHLQSIVVPYFICVALCHASDSHSPADISSRDYLVCLLLSPPPPVHEIYLQAVLPLLTAGVLNT